MTQENPDYRLSIPLEPNKPIDGKPGKLLDLKLPEEMGMLIEKWIKGDVPVPTTIDELKKQLRSKSDPDDPDQIAHVSEALTSFRFIQPCYYGEYIIVLPHLREWNASKAEVESGAPYDIYEFYERKVCPPAGRITDLEFFYSRVGDYTIAACM